MLKVAFTSANKNDAYLLAEIRAETMRDSLTRVGRFDETRVRERFLKSFDANQTWNIEVDDKLIGFFVLTEKPDHLYLDHIYVSKPFQRLGLGQEVIALAKSIAKEIQLPIRLCALVKSPANKFYLKCGFHQTHSTALDNFYEYDPQTKNP